MRFLFLCAVVAFCWACATTPDGVVQCEAQASSRLAAVFRAYESYRDEGLSGGLISRSRLALEEARSSLDLCPRGQQRRPTLRELRDDFETAEILVKELEEIRGVRFIQIFDGSPIWLDATTGKEINADIAMSI